MVDVDWYVEDPQPKFDLKVDLDKGCPAWHIRERCYHAPCRSRLEAWTLDLLHTNTDREDVPINVRVSRADRSSIEQIESLKMPTASGQQVSLGELTTVAQDNDRPEHLPQEHAASGLRHRRRRRGGEESPVYAILEDEQGARQAQTARRVHAAALQLAFNRNPPSAIR